MLCEFAIDFPELVGSLEDVREEGAEPVQKECTPHRSAKRLAIPFLSGSATGKN